MSGVWARVRELLESRRTTSAGGVAFIAREEGFVGHEYFDFAGVRTIGYGHALGPGEHYPNGITEPEARELLRRDLDTAERAVTSLVEVPIRQAQFDALVSFTFNAGVGALKQSSVLRLLNAGDVDGAAAAFELWVKYTDPKTKRLEVSPTLVGRRRRERAMFSDG